MNLATARPHLLLAASLLCAFSVVAVIGYHAGPVGANASATLSLPPASDAEVGAMVAAVRAERVARGESETPLEDAAGYTIAPDGTGLVPTRAPGGFVDAEAAARPEPVDASASAPDGDAAETGLSLQPLNFTMPGSRRPASAGKRSAGE